MHRSEAEGRFGEAEPAGRSGVCARATPIGVFHSATAYHGHVTFAERFALRREDRDHEYTETPSATQKRLGKGDIRNNQPQ